jgi:hypothetical protein
MTPLPSQLDVLDMLDELRGGGVGWTYYYRHWALAMHPHEATKRIRRAYRHLRRGAPNEAERVLERGMHWDDGDNGRLRFAFIMARESRHDPRLLHRRCAEWLNLKVSFARVKAIALSAPRTKRGTLEIALRLIDGLPAYSRLDDHDVDNAMSIIKRAWLL